MMASQDTSATKSFVCGGLSSMAASVVTQPIDLFKVQMQMRGALSVQPTSVNGFPPSASAIWSTITRSVWQEKGIRGFYQGLSAALMRQGVYSSTRFAVYGESKRWFRERSGRETNFVEKIICAAVAGVCGSIVGTPADVVLVRMQADVRLPKEQRRNYKHVGDGFRRIVQDEGFLHLWKGCLPNMQRAITVTIAQLCTYDTSKSILLRSPTLGLKDDLKTHVLASLMTGVVVVALASPVDVVKTRVMNAQTRGAHVQSLAATNYTGPLDCVKQIYRLEGIRGFYKGALTYYSRVGPHVLTMFVAYEQISKWYDAVVTPPMK